MTGDISGDMALFIWLTISDAVIAAVAVATVFTVTLQIATYFHFLLTEKGSIQ